MTVLPGLTPAVAAVLASRRVARLATVNPDGAPHLVPICFIFDGTSLTLALDSKPKRVPVTSLRRVRNLLAEPRVAVLVDDYDDDWRRLGYVLVHGQASLLPADTATHEDTVAALRHKYPAYRQMDLAAAPLITIAISKVISWGTLELEAAASEPNRLGLPAIVRGRRSVRTFANRPVPRELVMACLEAAAWAPSPHGRQPWRFAIVTRQEPRERLANAMAAEWERNLRLDGQPEAVVQTQLEKSRQRLFQAPVLIVPCLYLADLDAYPDDTRQAAETTMAVQSLGAAIQNLLLTAYHLGLDTGWMCAPLFCPEAVVGALRLDARLIPQALIPLGYAARDPVRRPRRPLAELIALDD